MKKLIFLSLFVLPFLANAQFTIVNTSTVSLVDLRPGTWPISLQRVIKESDTTYALVFRDQQYVNDISMATLRFKNLSQVKFFQQALSALKNGSTGDVARFKEYTVKRMDEKKGVILYILTCTNGELTNFQQPDADRMIAAILPL
ncbi:MAG: hypothetical protein Q8927_12815 [Bacteroidota bacterium]|nr:hypothetical protein [Bacteroidota bacterium]MDP4217075.1 hypothetical protein [Bacteroidota bacterium]MDP4244419.1 hypothetical protein [Bacteroidota bacterium]MDP4259798.1 hypothetical protein [Bacteroidota bacterium]